MAMVAERKLLVGLIGAGMQQSLQLLKAAGALGCATLDGGSMALGQAPHAFELFTGIAPHAARMEQHFQNLPKIK